MGQLPLLPTLRIRRPLERDREPHGQHRIYAAKEVSLITHNTRPKQRMLTSHMHFITRHGKGQSRTVIVEVGGVLTEMVVADRCPRVFVVNNRKMERGSREISYLRETHRQLDINLHGDHGDEIYRRLCNDRANQR